MAIGVEQRAQLQAREARLRRFAEAAHRHINSRRTPSDLGQQKIPEALSPIEGRRRDYQSRHRVPLYLSLAKRIMLVAALEFEMSVEDMLQHDNSQEYCIPRFVAMGLMLNLTKLSLPSIGRAMGGRDHTTVINGRKRINALLESEAFRNRFDQMKAEVAR